MKVLILGGGITGLSAAWFVHQKYPHAEITLLEKGDRLGGWIRSSREGDFFFEKGPRTFAYSRSPHLLALLRDLKLHLLHSKPQTRYLWHRGRLRSLGSFLPRLIPALIRELFIPPATVADESIYDFASRRFGPYIAQTLFDPLTLGIYGGDIRKLSIRCCFPSLYRAEREKGSVIRGLFTAPKTKGPRGLFTLKDGMETLIHELHKRIPMDVIFNCPVTATSPHAVTAGGKNWEADHVLSALPLPYPARSLWVVNLAFAVPVLPKQGYGYLVPTQENEVLLGTIFDSSIFPEQNSRPQETRITSMVRPEEPHPVEAALHAARRHLGIASVPLYASAHLAENAIPQFEVGCAYSAGISVDASIQRGHSLSQIK
jgi:oxygen-dependent protoporphyrinogen oxidase